jgi:hypothetical protein
MKAHTMMAAPSECGMSEGKWHLKSGTCSAKLNVPAAQDRSRAGTRLLMGQWDVHGNWYEDQTESNIELHIEYIHM